MIDDRGKTISLKRIAKLLAERIGVAAWPSEITGICVMDIQIEAALKAFQRN